MAASVITCIKVEDYDKWRPKFDEAERREGWGAIDERVFRAVYDRNQVFVVLECESVNHAHEARRRLLDSGVLDGVEKHGPNVVEAVGTS